MTTWPRRPAPKRHVVLPPPPATPVDEQAPLAPQLVPRRILEAWGALTVLALTFALIAFMVVESIARFGDAGLEARIVYAALAIAGAAALLLYGASIVVYVLPTALGIRRR